jgi:hypothetical protein
MSAAQKTAILTQVGHFYFGAVGQSHVGANMLRLEPASPRDVDGLVGPWRATQRDTAIRLQDPWPVRLPPDFFLTESARVRRRWLIRPVLCFRLVRTPRGLCRSEVSHGSLPLCGSCCDDARPRAHRMSLTSEDRVDWRRGADVVRARSTQSRHRRDDRRHLRIAATTATLRTRRLRAPKALAPARRCDRLGACDC